MQFEVSHKTQSVPQQIAVAARRATSFVFLNLLPIIVLVRHSSGLDSTILH